MTGSLPKPNNKNRKEDQMERMKKPFGSSRFTSGYPIVSHWGQTRLQAGQDIR